MTNAPRLALLKHEGLSCMDAARILWQALTLTIGTGERGAVADPSGSGRSATRVNLGSYYHFMPAFSPIFRAGRP